MYKLNEIQVMLLEGERDGRRVIRYALHELGFANLQECSDSDRARDLIAGHNPQLLIVDLDSGTDPTCSVVRDIRHQRFGNDPFVVSMSTTWNPASNIIQQALDCGVDDIVVKPISVDILARRVTNLIENRKLFIANELYVGPDRRQKPRLAPDEPPLVRVPNTLRYKATGDPTAALNPSAMQGALDAIVLQKIQHLSIEVTRLASRLEQLCLVDGEDRRTHELMITMSRLVHKIASYVAKRQDARLIEIGRSMTNLMEIILRAPTPFRERFEILGLHSQAVTAALLDRDGAAKAVARALERVTRYVEDQAKTKRPAASRASLPR